MIQLVNFIPDIKTHIQSHLIVAAPSGMEPLSCLSNPRDQFGLYKRVDILGFGGDGQGS